MGNDLVLDADSVLPAEASRLLSDRVATYEIVFKYPDSGWHGCEAFTTEHYRRRSKRPGGQQLHPNSGQVQIICWSTAVNAIA